MRASDSWAHVLLFVLGGAAASACGTPNVACPAPAASAAEVDAFLVDAATRRCRAALRCVADEVERSQNLITEAHCIDRVLGDLRSRAIPTAVAAGTVCFDASETESCLAAVQREGCEERVYLEESLVWPQECAAAVAGAVADGGECAIDEECTSGDCFCGACATMFVAPGSCATAPCARGFVCNGDSLCVEARHEGQACTVRFAEERTGDCASNLLCVDGVCHRPDEYRTAMEGEDCYSPRDSDAPLIWCAQGLECDFVTAGVGVCSAPHAAGASCSGGAHGLCEEGTLCHGPAGSEQCLPFVSPGGECFSSGRGDPCEAGAICVLGESVCRAIGEEGASCALDEECYGFCNDGICERSSRAFCG